MAQSGEPNFDLRLQIQSSNTLHFKLIEACEQAITMRRSAIFNDNLDLSLFIMMRHFVAQTTKRHL